MFRIQLEKLRLPFRGGYYETEQKITQFIEVDVELKVDSSEFERERSLDHTVDYSLIPPLVKQVVSQDNQLLESMACDVVQKIRSSYTLVRAVKVTLTKYPQLGCAHNGISVTFED